MTKNKMLNRDLIIGKSVDIRITSQDATEIRADVVLENAEDIGKNKVIRLWGQIRDCSGSAVENALVKLIKVENISNSEYYEGIANTISDKNGFYQFELSYSNNQEKYKVLVNKTFQEKECMNMKKNDYNEAQNGNNNQNIEYTKENEINNNIHQQHKTNAQIESVNKPSNGCNNAKNIQSINMPLYRCR